MDCNEVCTVNYAQFVKLPKQEKKEKEIFTHEEIQKLIDNDTKASKITLMMIFTGMRIGELMSLSVEDYHKIYVIGGEKTEAGKNRIIPIAPQVRPYFAEFAAESTTGKLVGWNIDVWRRKEYIPMLERLGIPYKTPHSCRHTFASLMAERQMDANVLKKIMGHANISTTADIYIHSQDEVLIHALDDFKL